MKTFWTVSLLAHTPRAAASAQLRTVPHRSHSEQLDFNIANTSTFIVSSYIRCCRIWGGGWGDDNMRMRLLANRRGPNN
eukprot:scaffold255212_cov16-Prasinocladus_malaysianus.AAC.1